MPFLPLARPILAAIILTSLALVTGGCCGRVLRTADLSTFHLAPPTTDAAPAAEPPPIRAPDAPRTVLIVSVLDGSRGGAEYTLQPITPNDRKDLAQRLGESPALQIIFASKEDLGATCSRESIADLARRTRADWLLISSVDSAESGFSLSMLVAALTLGLTPFDVSCRGASDAAMFDVSTGRRLARWDRIDSGWQIAHAVTVRAARDQMIERTNRRMTARTGHEAAALLAEIDPCIRETSRLAKARLDGWGGDQ